MLLINNGCGYRVTHEAYFDHDSKSIYLNSISDNTGFINVVFIKYKIDVIDGQSF